MLCSNCKAPLSPDAKFCGKCGQKLAKNEPSKNNTHSSPPSPQQQPKQQKSSQSFKAGKLFLLFGVTAALAGGYGISQLYMTKNTPDTSEIIASADLDSPLSETATPSVTSSKPQEEAKEEKSESPHAADLKAVVEGQLKALEAGDIDKAYNDYVSKEFREATTSEAFQQFIKGLPILAQHRSYSFVETTEEGGKGFVILSLVQDPGKEILIEYTLTQEDNKWKIQGFRVDQFEESETEKTIRSDENKENTDDKTKENTTTLDTDTREDKSTENKSPDNAATMENHPEISKAISTIEGQLNALREHDISKAYQDYTTKEFQQATTLDQYKEAIKDYPLLSESTKVNYDFTHTTLDRDHVTIPVILQKGNDSLLVDVALVKIGNDWKIWGTEVKEATPTLADAAATPTVDRTQDNKTIQTIVEGQLSALRSNDLKKAYDYVSADFQQATPFPAFEEFVKQYPILTNHKSMTFGDVTYEGDKASVVAILQTPDTSNPIEYSLVKIGDQWKVYGFRLLVADQTQLSNTDKGEIIALINDQLAALKEGDIQKSYNFTAKEFQQATPLAAFEDFIKNYPIFKNFKSTSFSNATMDHNTAMMVVTLNAPDQNADVEYRIAKEDNSWKVWSISVVRNTSAAARPSSIKSSDLVQVIENQLEAIRSADYKTAYDKFTSKGFKEATSAETFEAFIHKNPVLSKNKSFTLSNFNFENDIGTVEGTLTSADNETEQVKSRLVYEDKEWKILSINILYALKPASQTTQFTKVDIGTDVDSKGLVINPSTNLQAGQQKITVNVHVQNGTKGTSIEATLQHVESGSKVAPVTTVLDRDGNSIVSYVFSAPNQGWPKGHYQLHLNASTGAQETVEFTIE